MQALVMDVANAVVAYRESFLAAMESKNYKKATFCIYGVNALLPAQYKKTFDTESYQQADVTYYAMQCPTCPKMAQANSTNTIKKVITVMGKVYRKKFIQCQCDELIPYHHKDIVQVINDDMDTEYYPEPPRISNIFERVKYESTFWKWANDAWIMLESQHQKLRASVSKSDTMEIEEQ